MPKQQHYEFLRAVTVRGIAHGNGAIVPADAIPAGNLANLLRVGWLRPCEPLPPDPLPEVKPPEPPPPAAKKK